MPLSTFIQLSKRILVSDMSSEIRLEYQASDSFDAALVEAYTAGQWYQMALVKEDNVVVGWYVWDDSVLPGEADPADKMSDHMLPISPAQIISAESSLLAAIRLFESRDKSFFFVLDGADIVGVLFYETLFKPAGRACLFTLTTDLEEAALRLCQRNPKESWDVLPAGRQQFARDVFSKRYPSKNVERAREVDFLRCTTFCDKGTVLQKIRLVSQLTRSQLAGIFSKAEMVRNACAHPDAGEEVLMERDQLGDFVANCHQLIRFIREALGSEEN